MSRSAGPPGDSRARSGTPRRRAGRSAAAATASAERSRSARAVPGRRSNGPCSRRASRPARRATPSWTSTVDGTEPEGPVPQGSGRDRVADEAAAPRRRCEGHDEELVGDVDAVGDAAAPTTPGVVSAAPTRPGARALGGAIALKRCVTAVAPAAKARLASSAPAWLCPSETATPRRTHWLDQPERAGKLGSERHRASPGRHRAGARAAPGQEGGDARRDGCRRDPATETAPRGGHRRSSAPSRSRPDDRSQPAERRDAAPPRYSRSGSGGMPSRRGPAVTAPSCCSSSSQALSTSMPA